jgi:hypothetical protein
VANRRYVKAAEVNDQMEIYIVSAWHPVTEVVIDHSNPADGCVSIFFYFNNGERNHETTASCPVLVQDRSTPAASSADLSEHE